MFVLVVDKVITDWQQFVVASLCKEIADIKCVAVDNNLATKHSIVESIQFAIERKLNHVTYDHDILSFVPTISDYVPKACDTVVNLTPNEVCFTENPKVWRFVYNASSLFSTGHIGEYEIENRNSTIDVYLYEGNNLLDISRFNPHYSAVRNWQNIVYSLHHIILKNIRKTSTFDEKSSQYGKSHFCQYLFRFYNQVFLKCWNSFSNKLIGFYHERWTIGLCRGNFLSEGIGNLKVLPMPKKEFWADPFLYHNKNNNKDFLFVERFPYKEKKGVISCAEIDDSLDVVGMRDVIVKDYHLSYPQIIEENGTIYMMPESSANKDLEVFKCDVFPDKWSLYTSAFHGKLLADTVYYKDKNGDSWLFTTECDSSVDLHCTLFNIYKVDSLKLNDIIPHRCNPIKIDSSCARNGGRIYEENGKLYRVAQDNTHGFYGYGISVFEITTLTIDDYDEHLVKHLNGNEINGAVGTHQMCQVDNMFVMDVRLN